MGRALRLDDASGRYIEFVKNTFPKGLRLDGLKIVVDCAHGAAYKVAPKVLWELGAEIIPLGVSPDGCNINDKVGALHIENTRQAVVENKAHLGISLDGDADRVIMIDEEGGTIDGDHILGLIAHDWNRQGLLKKNAVVATVMSNLGLEQFLTSCGLKLDRTPVGDRHVSKRMRELGASIGGEQSGHIILDDYTTTGDGIIAALQVLAIMVRTGDRVSKLARLFDPCPQVLRSVRFIKDPLLSKNDRVNDSIQKAEQKLGKKGRLLVRKSGTEPLIRLMAEGHNETFLNEVINSIILTMHEEGFLEAS